MFIGADPQIAEMAALGVRLRWPSAEILTAHNSTVGTEMVEEDWPDVVLIHQDSLDRPLTKVVQSVRRFSNVFMVVLSHQEDETDLIAALEHGADDYIKLPCGLTQLTTRIWVLFRNTGIGICYDQENPLQSGPLMINPSTYEVFLEGERLNLTSTEFRMLHMLVRNWGMVVSHKALESTLWGDQVDCASLVKKYVQRLRRKLKDDAREPVWIASIHSVGYRFIGPAPTAQDSSQQDLAVSAD
ncbi:MAG: response regulator transcription factor [Dehalococcoidia bacterium]